MAGKDIVLKSFVSWAGVERTSEFTSAKLMMDRDEIQIGTLAEAHKVSQGGLHNLRFDCTVMPDNGNVFWQILIGAYEDQLEDAIIWRKSSAAESLTNPTHTFSVRVLKLDFGGARGTAWGFDFSLPITTTVGWDDGTTQLTIGDV